MILLTLKIHRVLQCFKDQYKNIRFARTCTYSRNPIQPSGHCVIVSFVWDYIEQKEREKKLKMLLVLRRTMTRPCKNKYFYYSAGSVRKWPGGESGNRVFIHLALLSLSWEVNIIRVGQKVLPPLLLYKDFLPIYL